MNKQTKTDKAREMSGVTAVICNHFIALSVTALLAHSSMRLSFPFSLLSLLLLRHVAEQGKSQRCFRREPLVLPAVTWEERSQLARKRGRERGEVAGKGRRHGERRRGTLTGERQQFMLRFVGDLCCPLANFSWFCSSCSLELQP